MLSSTDPQKPPIEKPSLVDLVYHRLLKSILTGSLESGTELRVRHLAAEYHVSSIPIREALLRLAADGLIERRANHSAHVVRFSVERIVTLFEMRCVVEAGAARLAAERIEPAALDRLELLAQQQVHRHGDPDQRQATLDLDHEFHVTVAAAARNELLLQEVTRYNHRVRIIQWHRLGPRAMDAQTVYTDHLDIIAGLRAGDPHRAAEAMTRHLTAALRRTLGEYSPSSGDHPGRAAGLRSHS